MRPRFMSTAVLCLTGMLLAGCTCGVQREDGAPSNGNRASSTGSAALVAQPTAQTALGRQSYKVGWVKWSAALRDTGRYYK